MENKPKRVSWNKGRTTPKEVRDKISASHNPKSNLNLIPKPFKKGGIPWNKGLFGWNSGHEVSEETRRKISKANSGKTSWAKGKHLSDETKAKLSEAHTGKKASPETRLKMKEAALIKWGKEGYKESHSGEYAPMYGKHQTPEAKAKTSLAVSGEKNPFFGKRHPQEIIDRIVAANTGRKQSEQERIKRSIAARNSEKTTWNGGSSFFPYSTEFTTALREKIRKRDGNICQLCNAEKVSLAVHHIDYDKQNTKPENLISLCTSCHSKTNVRRTEWTYFFNEMMKERMVVNA